MAILDYKLLILLLSIIFLFKFFLIHEIGHLLFAKAFKIKILNIKKRFMLPFCSVIITHDIKYPKIVILHFSGVTLTTLYMVIIVTLPIFTSIPPYLTTSTLIAYTLHLIFSAYDISRGFAHLRSRY